VCFHVIFRAKQCVKTNICMHCMFSDNNVNSIMQEGMTFTVGMYLAVTFVTEVNTSIFNYTVVYLIL